VTLEEDGVAVFRAVLSEPECRAIDQELSRTPMEGAGSRNLLESHWCSVIATRLQGSESLAPILSGCVAVQCTFFDKTPAVNWLVPTHQDLSIPVAHQVEHPELKGWSHKEGDIYVQPPAVVLDSLVAIRLHLDDSTPENGPLRVVPGSHRLGRLSSTALSATRKERGEVECLVTRGGVVAMKPLLLHASSKSLSSRPRRVLHFLYGPATLPYGLVWSRVAEQTHAASRDR
jgi:hypothetical protein